jgi:alginate O-acetyltransferase complex protein AlgI
VASYIFYGAWNPPFALLLFATTALDFCSAPASRRRGGPGPPSAWLIASVTSNLSMLGFFKYGNFLLENFQWLLARAGVAYQPPHLDVFLPIGISFYTFHSLSYTLDVYRGVCTPTGRCATSRSPCPSSRSWSPARSCAPRISCRSS